jgi:hypothetical protein
MVKDIAYFEGSDNTAQVFAPVKCFKKDGTALLGESMIRWTLERQDDNTWRISNAEKME